MAQRFERWRRRFATGAICAVALTTPRTLVAQTLTGSVASLDAQNEHARLNRFTFLNTGTDVARFARAGYLERLRSSPDYLLHDVSYPVARPEVRVFVERLASQYRHACGERLVVTSLTRPKAEQPDNASPRSVHPTGMALDLRLPPTRTCRTWLEATLLSLETRGVLDVTLEHSPAHLHVALFPRSYASYVATLTQAAISASTTYTVKAADTLWGIAKRFGTTADALKTLNKLASDVIRAGQRLRIPGTRAGG